MNKPSKSRSKGLAKQFIRIFFHIIAEFLPGLRSDHSINGSNTNDEIIIK